MAARIALFAATASACIFVAQSAEGQANKSTLPIATQNQKVPPHPLPQSRRRTIFLRTRRSGSPPHHQKARKPRPQPNLSGRACWQNRAMLKPNVRSLTNISSAKAYRRNPVLAWQWYRRAADSGDVLIQYLVGSSYLYGDEHLGVIMDRAEAAKWYRRAAAQGEKSVGLGQRDLFRLYERKAGGVPKDDVLAYMWYNLAAAKEGGRVSVSPRRPFIGTPRLTRDSGSRSPRRGNWACGIQSLGGGRETSPNNVSQHSEA